jgi:hypothetical protein
MTKIPSEVNEKDGEEEEDGDGVGGKDKGDGDDGDSEDSEEGEEEEEEEEEEEVAEEEEADPYADVTTLFGEYDDAKSLLRRFNVTSPEFTKVNELFEPWHA